MFTPAVLRRPGFWFSDDDGSVHEAAIESLAAVGVTRGCRQFLYCPDEELTRGQFASLLARAFPDLVSDDTVDYFSDDDNSVHETAINALTAADVATGCGPTRFCPADPIRRDQAAAVLARALGLEPAEIEPIPWQLDLVAEGIDSGATDLQAPTGDDRAFLVTRLGMIHIIADGTVSPEPFLDLTHEVLSLRRGSEQGMLGLAFHPDYNINRKFFVFYTDLDGHSQVYQYQTTPDNPNQADPTTAQHIITLGQGVIHQGGQLQFGADGYLYIAVGDGGYNVESQNLQTPLGTILRIDVDNGDPYSIPADNPYADSQEGLPEIWAYGLRNPWRFSFDGPHIYIADVGGAILEEINITDSSVGGINYGWPTMEGTFCSSCDTTGLFLPTIEYSRGEGLAVIGGYVYRGDAIPEMTGHYFYTDVLAKWIRTLAYTNGEVTEHYEWPHTTKDLGLKYSFGTDGHGEIYLLTDQSVYKIVPR